MSVPRAKGSAEARGLVKYFVLSRVFTVRSYSHPAKPTSWELPTIRCPRLVIQYTSSYSAYLEAFSVRSLRTRQAAMKVTPLISSHTVTRYYGRLVVSSNGKMSHVVQISCSIVAALEPGFSTCGTEDTAKTRPRLRITCLRITF